MRRDAAEPFIMKLSQFTVAFEKTFSEHQIWQPSPRYSLLKRRRNFADVCPDVTGMSSSKKLKLLNLAVSLLPKDGSEAYLEVGTYLGKSLISALRENSGRSAIACDDFSEFQSQGNGNINALKENLLRYGMLERVKFYNEDFRALFSRWSDEELPRIGVYLYDGAHDEQSQYDGIRMVEPLLANNALVIVDDWRYAPDSESYAEAGTKQAIAQSAHRWKILWELPARFNGDREMWWNGVAVLAFQRVSRDAA
jgi:predicted O-methyltransferase YrrM